MASFAKLGLNGKVLSVVAVNNNILLDSQNVEQEQKGIDFLTEHTDWPIWAQCSYNTSEGVHLLGGTPFRKNFPGVGYKYDEDKNAFIPPKPYSTWILDEDTCTWKPPVEKPNDGLSYTWNHNTQSWDQVDNQI
jgi:hypothetical protein